MAQTTELVSFFFFLLVVVGRVDWVACICNFWVKKKTAKSAERIKRMRRSWLNETTTKCEGKKSLWSDKRHAIMWMWYEPLNNMYYAWTLNLCAITLIYYYAVLDDGGNWSRIRTRAFVFLAPTQYFIAIFLSSCFVVHFNCFSIDSNLLDWFVFVCNSSFLMDCFIKLVVFIEFPTVPPCPP